MQGYQIETPVQGMRQPRYEWRDDSRQLPSDAQRDRQKEMEELLNRRRIQLHHEAGLLSNQPSVANGQ